MNQMAHRSFSRKTTTLCVHCAQARATRQEQEIGRLTSELSRLEDERTNQEASIQRLHDSVGRTNEESERKRDQTTQTIQALSSELCTTKQALDDVTKRERQVSLPDRPLTPPFSFYWVPAIFR